MQGRSDILNALEALGARVCFCYFAYLGPFVAEYRKSLLETLSKGEKAASSGGDDGSSSGDGGDDDDESGSIVLPPVTGKIKVKLSDAMETEVEASAYMAELRNEVSALRGQVGRAQLGEKMRALSTK